MKQAIRGTWLFALAILVGGCELRDSGSENTAMSAAEAQALAEAAEMLAQRRLPEDGAASGSTQPATPAQEEPDR